LLQPCVQELVAASGAGVHFERYFAQKNYGAAATAPSVAAAGSAAADADAAVIAVADISPLDGFVPAVRLPQLLQSGTI